MATVTPDRLVDAYQSATNEVRNRVVAYVSALWSGSSGFRDADVERLIAKLVPVVQAGQVQVAQLTDAYIGRQAVLAGVVHHSGVDREAILGYRGTPVETVYRRPAVATYTALAGGASYPDAVKLGLERLITIAGTDLQQAKNRQSAASIESSGFAGYRRVLTGRENCAFCAIASTQRYHKKDLMPIHPGCDCGVKPFNGNPDVQVIEPEFLEQIHATIDAKLNGTDRGARELGLGKVSSSGQPLSDFTDLIIVNDHGELGPTLAWRSDKFTSASDIEALAH